MFAIALLAAASVAGSSAAGSMPSGTGAAPASAQGAAVVRIIRPALIGEGFGPPMPGMTARATTVAAPDGRAVPIRLYEFE